MLHITISMMWAKQTLCSGTRFSALSAPQAKFFKIAESVMLGEVHQYLHDIGIQIKEVNI